MSASALCIGHAAWDLCFVLEAYPAENSKVQSQLLVESGGGPAANAAWVLAKWGVPTALAALLGNDTYGQRALAEMVEARVDCRLTELRSSHRTPVSAILINRHQGSRTVINQKEPCGSLNLSTAALSGLNPALLLLDGHELDASLAAMRAFPKAVTILDAGSLRQGTQVLSRCVDYLVCSQRFAEQLTGELKVNANWQQCLRQVQQLNGKVAVVTLGEDGLVFDDGRQQGRLPALPVRAVDTTAAGDIFHGAFAYGLLKGMDLMKILRLATVAAGLSVQKFGGRPSAPDLAAVLEAIPS